MNRTKTIIAVLISLLVLGYVFVTLDWDQTWNTLRLVHVPWLFTALVFHLLTYVIRTFRFTFLLDSSPRFLSILGATNLYGMYLYLMPAKTGELSMPLLYKENLNIPLTHSTAALVAARFLDLVMMALLLPLLLIFQWTRLMPYMRLVIISVCLMVIILWIIFLYYLRNPGKLDSLLRWFDISNISFLNRIGEIGQKIYNEMRRIYVKKKFWPALLISAGIWLLVQNTLYSIISSLGFQVTLLQVVGVTLVMIPFTFIPVQGFANLGTYEISIVLAFSLYGVTSEDSLNIAVGSHVIYIGFSFILGLLGFGILRLTRNIQKVAE